VIFITIFDFVRATLSAGLQQNM